MKFSKKYKTFSLWKKGKGNSNYVKRIKKLHDLNPRLTLTEIRNAKINDYDISKFKWKKLNNLQKYNRKIAFKILNSMRKGDSLKYASKKYGLTIKQAKIYLGNSIYKKNKKWYAKSKDRLEREMLIYEENIGKVIVIINRFKYAQLIGRYFSEINIAMKTGESSKLLKFQNKPVIDSNNETHYLETNLDKIYEYDEKIESSEFFDIYGD